MRKLNPSVSGMSILAALALALWEWYFFFYGGRWEGPLGWFGPDRLGFNLAWLALIYLSFQLLSIPFALRASRDRFIGVMDGLASIAPLGIALIVIFGKPELLGTPQRWEAAFLLLFIAAIDLFGGYTFNIALSRRMMDVGSIAPDGEAEQRVANVTVHPLHCMGTLAEMPSRPPKPHCWAILVDASDHILRTSE